LTRFAKRPCGRKCPAPPPLTGRGCPTLVSSYRFVVTQASTVVSFYAFIKLTGRPLTAAVAFPALMWLENTRMGLWVLPTVIQSIVQTSISLKYASTFHFLCGQFKFAV
jgi:hypothetical protein